MRDWKLVAGLAVIAALAGCRRTTEPTPTPTTIYIGGDTIIIGGVPVAPGASPVPGGNCSTVATVRNGFFGIGCQAGVSPRNGEGVLPMGCIGFSTATPKNAQGADVPPAVHGPNCAWDVVVGPDRVRLVEVEEVFNRNVIPQLVGEVQTRATVTPPSCGPISGTHTFQVVAARSSSGDVVAASVPEFGDVLQVYRESDGVFMGFYRLGDPWPTWLKAMAREAPEGGK